MVLLVQTATDKDLVDCVGSVGGSVLMCEGRRTKRGKEEGATPNDKGHASCSARTREYIEQVRLCSAYNGWMDR
jgi:hypothetical protein